MEKNYYAVLGVSHRDSAAHIRAAYHALAKRLHPDVAGTAGTPTFQEITEAYSVLSDPERRRVYDADFEPHPGYETQRRQAADSGGSQRHGATHEVEIVLSPGEALRGCSVPIRVQRAEACLWCGGSGWDWPFICRACGGPGSITGEERVWIEIPPRVPAGAEFTLYAGRRRIQILVSIAHEVPGPGWF